MSGDNKANKTKRPSQILSFALLGTVCLVLMALKPDQQPDQRKEQAMRATAFLDTIGVNTHVGSDPYNNPAGIASMLSYLGTSNIRQTSPTDAASLANMQALGKLGAKFDLIVNGGGPVNLGGALETARQLAPYMNAIEGVNEAAIWPITYGGLGGVDAAVALQKDLYAAVKADPALSHAPVYMFTLGGVDPGAFPSIGDLSAYTDFANIHSYPPHGLRPCFVIHAAIDGGRTDAPSKPVVVTETGYYTLQSNVGWGGVPESVQSNYLLGELLDEAVAGVSRTYLYDLIDDGADPAGINQEDHFGLFHNDGSPKLAATAIHNMTTLLADTGANSGSFPLDSFSFTATGVPYNYTGNTMLMQKSDGTHVIAVWNEEQTWNPDTQTTIPVQHFPTSVALDKSYGTVLVYDPTTGTAPVQTLHNVSSVALDLTDHPFLIVVPPSSTQSSQTATTPTVTTVTTPTTTPMTTTSTAPIATTPTTTTPTATTPTTVASPAPAAPGQLVLWMSEDAWQGDAQFTVTVDGSQVGGVRTATASHAAGQSQAVSVAGSFATGSHSVSVNFLNDAWGGTAATDRNLHVDKATLDGTTVAGSKMDLLQSGSSGFSFGSPAAGGADTLVLQVSEDAWQGDAQFAVTVDGVQQGAFTATASHTAGAVQAISLKGGWGAGAHSVGVAFLNDAWGGTAATDRNLYVNGISYDGTAVGGASATLLSNGVASFAVPAAGAPAPVNQALTLHLAEDAWQGDAHYSVAIDGKTVTADGVVTALNGAGQSQAASLSALLTPGSHDLSVSFLNDAWGGTPATDRNLYVKEIDVGGAPIPGASAALYSAGTTHFQFVVPSAAA